MKATDMNPLPDATLELNERVEAYESARRRHEEVCLDDFLPATDHPLRKTVLRELIRVDLEYRWESGRPRSVDEYLQLFPELKHDPEGARDIAFEEYRQRQQAGEDPSPAEYEERFGCSDSSGGQQSPWRKTLSTAPALRDPPLTSKPNGETSATASQEDMVRLGWEAPPESATDREVTYLLAQAMTALPEPGVHFAGFHLVAELGRGAFGRVYLARQGHLANRHVALKISVDLFGESQTLAQFQHTNIVPIYSVHQAGPFQAVCMPYFGPTTLADVVRSIQVEGVPASGKTVVKTMRERQSRIARQMQTEAKSAAFPPEAVDSAAGAPCQTGAATATLAMLERFSYVQVVLWIGARLADGLAHAHARGILHLDLKPANILLTDDGQPMLVDFNLSADTKRRGGLTMAQTGGTLPYMSPEQLEGFQGKRRSVDARSDLYSLGVILYELLTGRLPFENEQGQLAEVLPRMVKSRRGRIRPLRPLNKAVTPAVQSIVQCCLDANRERRYQSAAQLRDDMHRQLENLPLNHAPEPSLVERMRKWARRHPRLASPGAVGAILTIALGILVIPWALQKWHDSVEMEALAQDDRRLAKETQERADREKRKALAQKELLKKANLLAQREAAARDQLANHDIDMAALSTLEDHLNLWERLPEPGLTDERELQREVSLAAAALARYELPANPAWQILDTVSFLPTPQRAQLRADLVDLLYLLAREKMARLERPLERARHCDLARQAARLPRSSLAWDCFEAIMRGQMQAALSLNSRAASCFPVTEAPRYLTHQRETLVDLLERKKTARNMAAEIKQRPPMNARELYEAAKELESHDQRGEAIELLREATRKDPQNFSAWLVLAICSYKREQFDDAASSFSICIALKPNFLDSYLFRGKTYIHLAKWRLALADFDKVIQARPDLAQAITERGNAWHGMKKYDSAIADYSTALTLRPGNTGILYLRAEARKARKAAGDLEAARKDLDAIARSVPNTSEGWTYRGIARSSDEPEGALDDFNRALALNPRELLALYRKAQVLSNLSDRGGEAVQVLHETIKLYPDYVEARSRRGLLLAYLRKSDGAHADAEECLRRAPTPAMEYRAGEIYALTSRDRPEDKKRAFGLLFSALRNGYGSNLIAGDAHLAPLHGDPDFTLLQEVAGALTSRASTRVR
jgi:serine/threonine protein kinase/Tfp pilus assembly protein PilF